MDKRLRLSVRGTIGFLVVFAIILWMWSFFRNYLLLLAILLMIMGLILSAAGLWFVRDKIRAEIVLPRHRVGKNTDIPVDIRVLHSLHLIGFAVDITYQCGNLFTGSMEEKKGKVWAAPGKGGSLRHLLSSRYAGQIRVSVEKFRVYDSLHLFFLEYQAKTASEVMVWPAFSDEEDAEERFAHIEGFPRENESRKRGVEYNPDYEVREYAAGDELKNIHWKLSAKQGELMVRERLAAGKEKVNVLLPLGRNPDENDALMETLYGLCRLLLSRGYPVQLFWQGVSRELCSRCIREPGELETGLEEILSINGIRDSASLQEQMAMENPAESYILVRPAFPEAAAKKTERTVRKKKSNTADISFAGLSEKDRYDIFAVLARTLILCLLVYGSVGGFLAAFEIAYHSGLCMVTFFALAFGLSAFYETEKRWLTSLTGLIALLLFCYVAVTNYWTINNGYYYILNRIFDVAREYFDVSGGMEYALTIEDGYVAVTTFAIFIGMVGIILLNIRLYHKATLFRVMILTLTPYVIPMYFECSPPLRYSAFLLIGYAAVMVLAYGRGRASKQMRFMLPVTAAVTVLLVITVSLIMPEQRYARLIPQSRAKEESGGAMERFARYGMTALFPQDIAGSGISGGKLSKGSAVMPGYESALVVRYTPYSFEPVYLKAFTGLDYIGTSWTEAQATWPEDANMDSSLRSRYDAFWKTDAGMVQGLGIMEVERADEGDEFEYRPYYTDYHTIERKDGAFVYQYYPDNGEVALLSDEEPDERYLDVPGSCEAAVSRICEEAGFGGTEEEIAEQVVTYFKENYHYTLRPGLYYGNPDYISHFLLESKKGYCAHFASAAVMLFRQMGIPARYAEGYAFSYADVVERGELVEEADYYDYYTGFSELGETALIQIEIPSASAHAWVEIFDSERGWLVVDPTPSSNEEETASFWDVFMRSGDGGDERTLGEDILGEYMETVLGAAYYVIFAAFLVATIVFTTFKVVRKEKERRLSGRERVKLEYERLQKAAQKRDREFQTLRTLKEQIAWMRENCRAQITEEQEEALYQAFFAKDMDYDCDKLCGELKNSLRRFG